MKLMRNPLFYTAICALIVLALIWARAYASHVLGPDNWMDPAFAASLVLFGLAVGATGVVGLTVAAVQWIAEDQR